jgi:hypothetical protein
MWKRQKYSVKVNIKSSEKRVKDIEEQKKDREKERDKRLW